MSSAINIIFALLACVVGPAAASCEMRSTCTSSNHCHNFLDYLTCIAQDKQVFGVSGSGMCESYGSEYNKAIGKCPNWS